MRIEQDTLGQKSIPKEALYGIHTARALDNFPIGPSPVSPHLIKGFLQVKKAAAMAHKLIQSYEDEKAQAIIQACDVLMADYPADAFPLKAIQGGAGTSTNMNVNEVVANKALDRI